ncbi:MAG: glycosyltransferase family 2 protein, partial [Verrucomicrobia bacterium]|nr:glycosyltransferase family 2 protein [Verrucomicrobiota bacterium]
MPHLVQRVEFRKEMVIVHVLFKRSFWHFGRILFYLIVEGKARPVSRRVYGAALPKESAPFFLTCHETRERTKAEFIGNRSGGEVQIPLSAIGSFERLYAQIGEPSGETVESAWIEKSPSPATGGHIVAVIPCYDVASYCEPVILGALQEASYVVAIDDGSTDQTASLLDQIARDHPTLHVIHFAQNQGKGSALLAGFKYALEHWSFDVLVTLDGDGQHRPTDIPAVAKEIFTGKEFAIGERTFALMPWVRRFSNFWIAFFLRFFYPNAPIDTQSGFRAFHRELVEAITHQFTSGRYEVEFQILLYALSQHRKFAKTTISTIYL